MCGFADEPVPAEAVADTAQAGGDAIALVFQTLIGQTFNIERGAGLVSDQLSCLWSGGGDMISPALR